MSRSSVHAEDLGDEIDDIDVSVSCASCDAVCCRLTVILMPEDRVPPRFTAVNERGVEVMAHNEEGWCAALDPLHMCCSIYDDRPAICRKFAMGGAYCRSERAGYREAMTRGIPLKVW